MILNVDGYESSKKEKDEVLMMTDNSADFIVHKFNKF